jgi:hypothetical protein
VPMPLTLWAAHREIARLHAVLRRLCSCDGAGVCIACRAILHDPEKSRQAPALVRFERMITPEPNTGCWLWLGTLTPKGYPRFGYLPNTRGTRSALGYAHRFSYETFIGPVPAGLELDHLCTVRCCVNPRHLEAVDHWENVRRQRARTLRLVYQREGPFAPRPRPGTPTDDLDAEVDAA